MKNEKSINKSTTNRQQPDGFATRPGSKEKHFAKEILHREA